MDGGAYPRKPIRVSSNASRSFRAGSISRISIPNSLTRTRGEASTDLGSRPQHRVVLLPGRITRLKGHGVFPRRARLMKREGKLPPDVLAVLAGDPQGRDDYYRDVHRGSMHSAASRSWNRTFRTWRRPISRPRSSSRLRTVPESFGRVPPEAALMGRAVIAPIMAAHERPCSPGNLGCWLNLATPPRLRSARGLACSPFR